MRHPAPTELPDGASLLRATLGALALAGVLLVTVVMPAEYALDPTGAGRLLGLLRMGEIKQGLASERENPANPAPEQTASAPSERSDTITLTLKPGEDHEIKLHMKYQGRVHYSWSSHGVPVSHDTHGEPYNDPTGFFHSYRKGKQVDADQGEFSAVFDGTHGWYWRNVSDREATITLTTRGTYSGIKGLM